MRFRPCIDLRDGRVVQIVGGTLNDSPDAQPQTNFESDRSPTDFARLYRADDLRGGHVISLGSGNREAALSALQAFPAGLQMGGGITPENAATYLDAGASHVIVTSYVFRGGGLHLERLETMVRAVGKERLVLDLSCRQREETFWVVTERWQNFTEVAISRENLSWLASYCAEFLVHAVDVEGLRAGVDEQLVRMLGEWAPIPVTYAGGAKELADLDRVLDLGQGRVDLTIGSALDIFGGEVAYADVVAWHRKHNPG